MTRIYRMRQGLGDFLSRGSRLVYQGTYGTGIWRTDPESLIAKLYPKLQSKWGITIERSSANQGILGTGLFQAPEITLYLVTQSDYGKADDIRRIVDGEIYALGESVTSSRITSVSPATGSGVWPTISQQQAAQEFTEPSSTWVWIAVAVAAAFVVPSLVRR